MQGRGEEGGGGFVETKNHGLCLTSSGRLEPNELKQSRCFGLLFAPFETAVGMRLMTPGVAVRKHAERKCPGGQAR